jgi:hypothetical protein
MRAVAWLLVTLGGAVAWWRWGGGPWALAWCALCVAFAFTARKLTWSDAFRLWTIVLGSAGLLLGGMVVLESRFGGFAAGLWLVVCVVSFLLLRKRLLRAVPMLHLTQTFDEVVKGEESGPSWLVGCLGFAGFLGGMMLFIALWGTAGGAAWFLLFFVVILILMSASRSGGPS